MTARVEVRAMDTMVVLPSVRLGEKQVRFVYLRSPISFYVTDRAREDDIPLFLGADILAGSNILTKNHGRIHGRFSKEKCATKVTIKGVTVKGINHSSQLWFYNVQGLFRATFEYLNTASQSDCLQYLTDLWLQTKNHSELAEEMSLNYSQDNLVQLSDLLQLHDISESHQGTPPLSETQVFAYAQHDPNVAESADIIGDVLIRGGNNMVELAFDEISTRVTEAESVDALECNTIQQLQPCGDASSYGSVMFIDRLSAPDVLDKEVNVVTEAEQNMQDGDTAVTLEQVCQFVVTFLTEHGRKVPEAEQSSLKKLRILLDFFRVEYLDSDPKAAGFPITLLEQYAALVPHGAVAKHSQDTFNTASKVNIALCVVCEWLGKELHGFSEDIAERGEIFKLRHIDSINSLPSPQSLVESLFPACMRILMLNWMGQQQGMWHGDGDGVGDLSAGHDYNPLCKKAKSASSSTKQLGNAFPFIQLILEFANNVLISGVAHVLYSRLLHDGSC